MKKIILFLMIIVISGCANGNKDFETVCTKKEESNGFINEQTVTIYFDDTNNIKKIVDNYKYLYTNEFGKSSFEGAKLALSSNIKNSNYVKEIIKDLENEYEISYTLNVENMSDEQIKNISLKRNYYDQIKYYEQDMLCN